MRAGGPGPCGPERPRPGGGRGSAGGGAAGDRPPGPPAAAGRSRPAPAATAAAATPGGAGAHPPEEPEPPEPPERTTKPNPNPTRGGRQPRGSGAPFHSRGVPARSGGHRHRPGSAALLPPPKPKAAAAAAAPWCCSESRGRYVRPDAAAGARAPHRRGCHPAGRRAPPEGPPRARTPPPA